MDVCSQFREKRLLDVVEQRIDLLNRLLDGGSDKRARGRARLLALDGRQGRQGAGVVRLRGVRGRGVPADDVRPTRGGRVPRVRGADRDHAAAKPALEWLPVEEFDLDFGCLTDAEVVVSTSNDPYAPANRHADVMAESGSFRGLLPAVGPNQLEAGREAVERRQEQRLVVERGVADALRTRRHYAEKVEELVASPWVEISVYDGTIPYFLGLYDETVHVGVEDEDGMPRDVIEATADDVREWAESVFADYERQARSFA